MASNLKEQDKKIMNLSIEWRPLVEIKRNCLWMATKFQKRFPNKRNANILGSLQTWISDWVYHWFKHNRKLFSTLESGAGKPIAAHHISSHRSKRQGTDGGTESVEQDRLCSSTRPILISRINTLKSSNEKFRNSNLSSFKSLENLHNSMCYASVEPEVKTCLHQYHQPQSNACIATN